MQRYKIGGAFFEKDGPGFIDAVARAHAAKERPLCDCIPGAGVPMYIAKVGGSYAVKRMPDTGSSHDPECDSYEPPPELSGLGQLLGGAINENADDGTTVLKFDFSLTKSRGRMPPSSEDGGGDSVSTSGNKLSLRGTLHYLWTEAQFNRWTPAMTNKRNWHVIRKFLIQAAQDKISKGMPVASMLYIPETWSSERKHEIAQRRSAQFMHVAANGGPKKLLIAIGEVVDISPSRYGYKVVLKHAPDCPFMLNDDLHKKLRKRFCSELELNEAFSSTSHLMMIATFGVSASGIPSVEEMALMCVSENWLPFESVPEKNLLDTLCASGRRFLKGMRYNLSGSRPLAFAVLTDAAPAPTALYVDTPAASNEYRTLLASLRSESKLLSWIWSVDQSMPELPASKIQ